MLLDPRRTKILPDIAVTQKSTINTALDWVGMENIKVPILLDTGIRTMANVHIFVNLIDPTAKGIHMSRLYLAIKEALSKNPFNLDLIKQILIVSVDTQKGLSTQAKIEVDWESLLERKALLSDNAGWKSYPMQLNAIYNGADTIIEYGFSTFYSSTCPCSAALARQLFQKDFSEEFVDRDEIKFAEVKDWLGHKQAASAHSQRSRADVTMKFADEVSKIDFEKYIDAIEDVLKTPVQTAVKRADEQEFARLNGENMMFVEDALRKMKHTLGRFPEIIDFQIKATHFESLHAHDATGVVTKNLLS